MKIKKWRKLISYYKPYKLLFFVDLFCAMMTAVIAVVIPLIIRYLMNEVMFLEKREALKMATICVGVIIMMIFALYACSFVTTYYGHLVGARIEKDMRNELFSHYQKLSLNFYENKKVGELMSRIVVDLENLNEFLHHFPEEVLIFTIRLILVFCIFFSINPLLAFIALWIIIFCISYVIFLIPKVNKTAVQNKEKISDINTQIEDSLSGIRVVKSFANEKIEMRKFKNSSLAFVKSKRKYLKQIAILFAGMNSFVIGLIPIVATAGIYLVINHLMPVKDLITFILCVDVLIAPFFSILETCETMINAMAGYKRFINVMEIKPDIVDIDGAEELKNILGDIQFKNVVFKYKNGHKNVLENLTLKIKPKEYIALVGSSGVGKSTLCNLLPRFYDVTSGAILIDGHNVKDVTLKSLRENIGHVQQDTYLFAGTIRENIAYGKFDATEEEIINAAKNAYAHDFIMEFSKGYDTDIGQRGIKLSGGQKQRLSIARVFLKNPQILILDEATSALDNESEKFIQKSLENLSTTRTTLVIAHRLSTIKKAERILVMNHKGIVEEGNHKEFLKKGGVYTELYNMQF